MEETTQLAQEARLKTFNERLRDFFHPNLKLTEQEEVIMNIIYKILAAPSTIKYTPHTEAYYLINYDIHYFVRVGWGTISIVNSVDSIARDCTDRFSSFIRETIDRAVEKDVSVVESTIFHNELKILKKINDRL